MKWIRDLTRKQKRNLLRILVSGAMLLFLHFLPIPMPWKLAIYLVPYLTVGYDILWNSVRNILHGQLLDENFLMAIATIGAFCIGDYPEGVFVMLFYQIGELFQSAAVAKSRRSVAALMDIRPDYANADRNGRLTQVDPEEVEVGEIITVKPGEKIPLDGVVTEGTASLDTAALTGESVPRDVQAGDSVTSGCICQNGVLKLCVSRAFGESTVSKILDLVENAGSRKAKAENFIAKFAHYYTPAVVGAAVLTAVLPPLLGFGAWNLWLHKALIFLVISCPCALVISVPLGFFGGIGGASKNGILIKGANYMEILANAEIVVMDKTGTLTKGSFNVTSVRPATGWDKERLLDVLAHGEGYSTHPIAASIRRAYAKEPVLSRVTDASETAGHGVFAKVDGRSVLLGNRKLMLEREIAVPESEEPGTVIYAAVDGIYAGLVVISDEIKPDAAEAIRKMKQSGVRKCVMLTGDSEKVAEKVARTLGIDEYRAQLLPEHKVKQVETLMEEKSPNGSLIFVGDGINDAPVLVRADVGIAMGGLGSDAAIEAADAVIMNDEPSRIPLAIRICRRTLRIVKENIWFALAVKLIIMILSFFDCANMWEAVFADVGVSVIAILNSMRALDYKER